MGEGNEKRTCQNCKNDFIIEPSDFRYYEKIKVPPPTWCPECRLIRRFSFQNTWELAWRNCDKCDKRSLSMFSADQDILAYCQPCWWADDWDGTEYGQDYDPTRPFLEQVKELMSKTPYATLEASYSTIKNSEYCNALGWSKDCYLMFWADYCESVYHSSILNKSKFSSDCIRGYDSELCYESVGFTKNYRVFFSDECDNCVDVWFSRNCYGCTDCIGCVNLRGASYHIFNKKYSKKEYEQKKQELQLDTWTGLKNLEQEAHDFWLLRPYRELNSNTQSVNVSGDHVYHSRNSKEMYIANGCEDCKYCQFITIPTAKDCMDNSGWGNNSSRVYESSVVGENSDSVFFSYGSWPDAMNNEYCFMTISSKNNFGCVNLKRKNYCILNKQYPKEEYFELKEKIIKDMKNQPYVDRLGRRYYYGEFFPSEMSRFPYNKTLAQKFFPKTKEEARKEGFDWEEIPHVFHQATIRHEEVPERINAVEDNILHEILKCVNCGNGYKVAQGELGLLRKMNLPIPRECPKCREDKRFSRLTKPKFFDRSCDKCKNDIRTPYNLEDPRIVYCAKCYQGEFL